LENNSQIKRILLPVDFSDNSLNACRYAMKIAHTAQSGILVFHAYYSPALDLIELTGGRTTRKRLTEDVELNLMSQAENEMDNFVKRIFNLPEAKDFKKHDLKTIVKLGSVKEVILSVAEEFQPDLVVMGTHGKNNSTPSLLGSITEFAIDKLHFAVLAIPAPTDYTPIDLKSIIYLTNFDETDFQSIKKLLELTGAIDVDIHCAHIGGGNEERKKVKLEGLVEYFKKAYDKSSIVYHLLSIDEKKKIISSIEDYIARNGIGMISLTHKQRNILMKYINPDLTKKIFYKIKIPLLVFHP
jgi:nucleotide-binding universal stress UspA family protein